MLKKVSSAARQARSSERKRQLNHSVKNRIRSGIKKFQLLAKTSPEQALLQGRQVVSWLDRAAKKGILHVNASRRHKAKVMAQIQLISKK